MSQTLTTSLQQTINVLANGISGFLAGFICGSYWTLYSMRKRGRQRR